MNKKALEEWSDSVMTEAIWQAKCESEKELKEKPLVESFRTSISSRTEKSLNRQSKKFILKTKRTSTE